MDPAAAVRHVGVALPELEPAPARALALVALAGRPRDEVASETDLNPERLAQSLAHARKALRRSMFPLAGSGWCERAERLISDRLDGALGPPGAGRLDVHLRNCPRCVEHERMLVHATDVLAGEFEQVRGLARPQAAQARTPPALAVVRPAEGPRSLPFGQPVAPRPAVPAAQPAPALEPPAPSAAPAASPELRSPRLRALPTLATVGWHLLLALALVFAVATVALAVAGAMGASLH
ncbi:MAG: zf-HC2 domain-containing protein [Thermoleophilaceae bacterium]